MGEIEQMEVEIDALAQTLASTAAALKAARAERDAATARAEAAEQRAEAVVADAQAAAHFAQSVAHLLASPGAEAEAVQHLRASDLPHLLDCLRERLAEQRAEALAAEVARLRAGWAAAAAEVAAMGAEPDTTGQVLTERRSPATRAALREVAQMLAEAQPAEVTDV